MKKKPPSKKGKTGIKTIKGKKAPIYINVNMKNSSLGTITNCIQPTNHPLLDREILEPSACQTWKTVCSAPGYNCVPRQGERVINGGFENHPDPFLGWVINAGVGLIKPWQGDLPHQGRNAVCLGNEHGCALLYQDISGICPGMYLQLSYFLSAGSACGNDEVFIKVEFLDRCKKSIDGPVLEILVPCNSLSNETYTGFLNATRRPAPSGTKFVRIRFAVDGNCAGQSRPIHLDDVSLIAI